MSATGEEETNRKDARYKFRILTHHVMMMHVVALGLCIVYCKVITKAAEDVPTSAAEMKNNTLEIYRDYIKHHEWDSKWIPAWLSKIQEQSINCCGILGYEDWKEFWPENPTEVPNTCCNDINKCINNLEHIEWPETPSSYIKTKGCAGMINEVMEKRMLETTKLLVLLTAMIGMSLVIFTCQYIYEFCATADNNDNTIVNDSVANLTVGETWARMGFNRTKKESKATPKEERKMKSSLDDCPDLNFDILPNPGSYTDIYLKQLQEPQTRDQKDRADDIGSLGTMVQIDLQPSSSSRYTINEVPVVVAQEKIQPEMQDVVSVASSKLPANRFRTTSNYKKNPRSQQKNQT